MYLTVASAFGSTARGGGDRADELGVAVAAPEVRLEHPRALQVEVHVDLPREAHAAEHLRGGLAVGDRGVAGDDLGAEDEPAGRRSRLRLVERRAGAVDGGARDFGAREHV